MQSSYMNQRIDDFLETEKRCNKELLSELSLFIYSQQAKENDLYLLARMLSTEDLIKIISYFDGDKIQLPTKEQFFRTYITSIAFYMKEILELDWKAIKEVLNLPVNEADQLSSISIGRNINNIKEKFSKGIYKILNKIDMDETEIKKIKKEVKDGLLRKKNK